MNWNRLNQELIKLKKVRIVDGIWEDIGKALGSNLKGTGQWSLK